MNITLEKAKTEKLFYVVTTGVIYHPGKKKCLILQRSKSEKAHPGLWGVVGGKMEWDDLRHNPPTRQNHEISDWQGLVEIQLAREAFEESGLKVSESRYLESVVFIRPDGIPVVLIQFALKYAGGEVKIPAEFDDFAWVDGEEIVKFNCIKGIPEEVVRTIEIYRT